MKSEEVRKKIIKNKKYILLSHPISTATPSYGGSEKLKVNFTRKIISGDSCNTAVINLSNHLGTHIDAPKHFFDDGRSITEYNIEELIFENSKIINCQKQAGELIFISDIKKYSKAINKTSLLLIRTGFSEYRDLPLYQTHNIGIAPETAHYLRTQFPKLRAVGIDSISISSFQHRELGREAHEIFLTNKEYNSPPLLLVEDMLIPIEIKKFKKIFIIPLIVEGIDSAPCTIAGEI